MNVLFILSLSFLYVAINAATIDIPKLGRVEGDTQKSLQGRDYYAFEGVPYAQPPVGDLRFKKAVPVKPWKGTWQAKTMHQCIQYSHYHLLTKQDPVLGDEDCLYLNIYTPVLNNKTNLDVIVYIHGGAFMCLYGGYYGPHYIMDRDVVFINFNYRLGPLGFLSTEDDLVPGNNGIRDQNLALQWIKNNVKYFGGNPESITIFGMSAGGASVHMHYLSPISKGLFNRGLSQSGCALNPWVLMEKPLEKTKQLGTHLGCTSKKITEIISCLKKRPARQIVSSVKIFQPFLYNPFSPFGVVVDSWSSDPVLPDHPYNLIKNGKVNDVIWIASQTDFEGLYPGVDFLEEKYMDEIDTKWNELLPHILDYNYTISPKLQNDVSQKIRKHFLGDKKLSRSNYVDFVKIMSQRLFDLGLQQSAKMQASVVKSPVYYYYFTYVGTNAWYESYAERLKEYGAAHAEDTAYILKTLTDNASTDEDRGIITLMLDILTSFAKSGVPEAPVEWKPLSKNVQDKLKVLQIDSPKKIKMDTLEVEDLAFWESLPFNENEKLVSDSIKDEL